MYGLSGRAEIRPGSSLIDQQLLLVARNGHRTEVSTDPEIGDQESTLSCVMSWL